MLTMLATAAILLAQGVAPSTPAPPEKPQKVKLVCEDERSTGSFIAKRVCRTPQEIEAARKAARRDADWVGDRTAFCKGRPGC